MPIPILYASAFAALLLMLSTSRVEASHVSEHPAMATLTSTTVGSGSGVYQTESSFGACYSALTDGLTGEVGPSSGWCDVQITHTYGSLSDNPVAAPGTLTCRFKRSVHTSCTSFSSDHTRNFDVTTFVEEPPTCSQGQKYRAATPDSITGTTSCQIPTGNFEQGCKVEWTAGATSPTWSSWFSTGEATGESCTAGTAGPAVTEQNPDTGGAEPCITGSNGAVLCIKPSTPNCGTFNGEYMCVPSIPSQACTIGANGGLLCAPDAASPPKPDDGVNPGTAVVPDGTFTTPGATPGTSRTAHWFSPATAAASSDTSQPGSMHNGDAAGGVASGTGIDEAGTPAPNADAYDGKVGEVTDAFKDGIGSEVTPGGVTYTPVLGGTGTCNAQQFGVSFLGSSSVMDLCPAINLLRGLFEWVFFILTAMALWGIWRNAGKGIS